MESAWHLSKVRIEDIAPPRDGGDSAPSYMDGGDNTLLRIEGGHCANLGQWGDSIAPGDRGGSVPLVNGGVIAHPLWM